MFWQVNTYQWRGQSSRPQNNNTVTLPHFTLQIYFSKMMMIVFCGCSFEQIVILETWQLKTLCHGYKIKSPLCIVHCRIEIIRGFKRIKGWWEQFCMNIIICVMVIKLEISIKNCIKITLNALHLHQLRDLRSSSASGLCSILRTCSHSSSASFLLPIECRHLQSWQCVKVERVES